MNLIFILLIDRPSDCRWRGAPTGAQYGLFFDAIFALRECSSEDKLSDVRSHRVPPQLPRLGRMVLPELVVHNEEMGYIHS